MLAVNQSFTGKIHRLSRPAAVHTDIRHSGDINDGEISRKQTKNRSEVPETPCISEVLPCQATDGHTAQPASEAWFAVQRYNIYFYPADIEAFFVDISDEMSNEMRPPVRVRRGRAAT